MNNRVSRVTSHVEHRQFGAQSLRPPTQFPAVYARHDNIGKQQIHSMVILRFEERFTSRRMAQEYVSCYEALVRAKPKLLLDPAQPKATDGNL